MDPSWADNLTYFQAAAGRVFWALMGIVLVLLIVRLLAGSGRDK